ncbi:hypothetical protein F4556_002385 [Kitasatospora gansuensis]|uniref:DNA polymerase III subunit beta n=1 Tax=Kitasatospora gansuensis TaxID=258050 RepID=A0A7W7SAE1_9ACTN|nr:hypothetical protein [Kitasatospora gansuensis]MBB4946850.1 hypothetical protein [Kitasatospora gansuensis]
MSTITGEPTTVQAGPADPGGASVTAAGLADIITRAIPHAYTGAIAPILASVHLDAAGRHLTAVATDRYTLAAARTAYTVESTAAWSATVDLPDARALLGFADAQPGREAVLLRRTGGQLHAASDRGRITVPLLTGQTYPNWRSLLARYLSAPAATTGLTGLRTELLERWQAAGRQLHVVPSNPDKPLLIFEGTDFIGLQMPLKPLVSATWDGYVQAWRDTLGIDCGGLDPAAEGALLPDPAAAADTMAERLLHRTLLSAERLHDLPGGAESTELDKAVRGLVEPWVSYRLLHALRGADPLLAERTVEHIEDELAGGEFAETAHELAEQAGHNPRGWIEDYRAARAGQPPAPDEG